MHSLFDSLVQLLINFINQIGYLGIFIGMFLESTLVPLPSELIMIPVGMSASQGGMNVYVAVIFGITGNISGAIFSYYFASFVGHPLLIRIGKYFFVRPETIIKMENFFKDHGPISVFFGRLLPGFRHFISLAAGIAKMDLKKFFLYTSTGSAIWTSILAGLGFFIGENQETIKSFLHQVVITCVLICILSITIYIFVKRKKNFN